VTFEWGDEALPERIWIKIVVDPDTECWNWIGYRNEHDYGVVRYDGVRLAHRVTFEAATGELPPWPERSLDHLCRNPPCCNPDHLEVVTPRENTLRGEGIAAREAAQTHCINNHLLSGDNLGLQAGGRKRYCKTCRRANDARRSRR
jgi:hypothetical protein